MSEKVQVFMHTNATIESLDKIVSVHLKLHKTVQMLSQLYFSGLSVSCGITVLTCVIVVNHMTIKPFAVLPCVIVLLSDFEA